MTSAISAAFDPLVIDAVNGSLLPSMSDFP
jgi:hypothetical protein